MSNLPANLSPAATQAIQVLGDQIYRARRRRGIKQEDLAGEVGVSRATLRRVEKGHPTVTMATVAAVLEALGLLESLCEVARIDVHGQSMTDERLPKRIT